MKVAVVGVCASGKSTLVRALHEFGIEAVEVAQEHSDVAHLWRTIARPDALIYLEANAETVRARSPTRGAERFIAEQQRRLAHARAHADLILAVDELTPEQVLARVLNKLEELHSADKGPTDG